MLLGALLCVTARPEPHITPLTFKAADPITKKRRKLSGAANRMHGDLSSLGYFSADLCLGTPAMSFDLILDTGSSLTALPCSGCSQCGAHQHGAVGNKRYDVTASSTGHVVGCGDAQCASHRCSSGQCAYSVSYTEGSSIRGHMVSDTFWLAGAEGARVGVPHAFGCQMYESGLFYKQVADGISGLQPSGGTLFRSLRVAMGAPDIFSICLSEEVGAMGASPPCPCPTHPPPPRTPDPLQPRSRPPPNSSPLPTPLPLGRWRSIDLPL